MKPGALPPYTARRLGPERAAQAQRLRERLAGQGDLWPDWIDARPGRLQVVIGDCAADPPLCRTTRALIDRHGDALLRGLGALALACGAPRMALAVRQDDEGASAALRPLLRETQVELCEVPPVWPSQPDLEVQGAWGRSLVVSAQVLDQVDAVLFARAPHRLCTVAGVVARPQVLDLGPGDTPADLIRRCGGATLPAWVALAGGAPAGQLWDRDQPLREGETLLLCLPQDHEAVQRLRRPLQEDLARARAVCPGCRLCTDACPQALRGAPLRPDLIASVVDAPSGWAQGCVGCGVCDAICPQGLSPARLLGALQPPQAGLWGGGHPPGGDEAPRAAKERRLPLSLLTTRLRLGSYAGP